MHLGSQASLHFERFSQSAPEHPQVGTAMTHCVYQVMETQSASMPPTGKCALEHTPVSLADMQPALTPLVDSIRCKMCGTVLQRGQPCQPWSRRFWMFRFSAETTRVGSPSFPTPSYRHPSNQKPASLCCPLPCPQQGIIVAAPIFAATGDRWKALGVATASVSRWAVLFGGREHSQASGMHGLETLVHEQHTL